MLEMLLNPERVESRPVQIFFLGMILAVASFFITYIIEVPSPCKSGAGLLFASFITIAATPIFMSLFKKEEIKAKCIRPCLKPEYFREHEVIIKSFFYFFFGVVLATYLLYTFLPEEITNYVFYDQQYSIETKTFTGRFVGDLFWNILLNNTIVLILAFILSLMFGAASVFVLTWNASVLGVFLSVIDKLYKLPPVVSLPASFLMILPYGFFEFLGYFIGAVAGGILSVGIIKEGLSCEFREVCYDAFIYLLIGFACIFFGAFIESFFV